MRLKKGQKIHFKCPDELAFGIKIIGTVVGYSKEIRKLWPIEMGELTDDVEAYLVKRHVPIMGEFRYYAVFPEDVSEIKEVKNEQ